MKRRHPPYDLAADTILLAIGAHPDDLEAIAGGTVAKLAHQGAEVYYLILTDGCRGTADPTVVPEDLVAARRQEQLAAAELLGVREVFFLDNKDCELQAGQELEKTIVSYIRQLKPDVVLTFDPTMLYDAELQMVNHPDHRVCGQAVIDAVFPLARDCLSYPELVNTESQPLQPHKVKTLLLSNSERQQYFVDISDTIDLKIRALASHTSQMPAMQDDISFFRDQAADLGDKLDCEYAEGFVRLDIRG